MYSMLLYDKMKKTTELFLPSLCSTAISNKTITKYFCQVIIDDVMLTHRSHDEISPQYHIVHSKFVSDGKVAQFI